MEYVFFWFIVSVILLILLLKVRDQVGSKYAKGYWDGYRAFGDEVKGLLEQEVVDKAKLQRLIDEGESDAPVGAAETTTEEPQELAYAEVGSSEAEQVRAMAAEVNTPAEVIADTPRAQPLPPPTPTPEEVAREKERVTLRNLNTMLYMGSFLLVAAAATFIAAAMPEMVRLGVLIAVTVAFYSVGIVLHKRVPRLRPAAVAFAGTGMAILPFVGVALSALGGMNELVAWLLVSVVGLVAYGYATVVLQSQVVSYLTMAFVLSLVSSAVAKASLPVVWYFIGLIAVSLVAASVSYLWPQRVPSVFKKSIETTGQVVTPVAMVASLFAARDMSLVMYEVLLGVGTAHYLVVWLQQRTVRYETIVRVLAHAMFVLVGYDLFMAPHESVLWFGVWWCGLWLVQFGYSMWRAAEQNTVRRRNESVWLVMAQIGLVAAPVFWAETAHGALLTTVSLVALGMVSAGAALRLRQVSWGIVGLLASWLLPVVVGQWLAEPTWPWWTMVAMYSVLAVASLAGCWWARRSRSQNVQQFFIAATLLYSATVVWAGVMATDAATLGWSLLVVGALLVVFSYVVALKYVEVVGVLLVAAAVAAWLLNMQMADDWHMFVVAAGAMATVGVGAVAHQLLRIDTWRRNALLIATMALLFFVWLSAMGTTYVVAHTVLGVIMAATLATFIVRIWAQRHTKSQSLQSILCVGYAVYLAMAWLLMLGVANDGWPVLVYALATGVLLVGSHVERRSLMTLLGNGALFAMVYAFWQWRELSTQWELFGVLSAAAVAYYVLYWLYVQRGDGERQWLQLLSAWTALVLATACGNWVVESGATVAMVVTLMASGMLLVVHGQVTGRDVSRGLRWVVSVAAGIYAVLALAVLDDRVSVGAWAFALSAVFMVWSSYLVRRVWVEVVAMGAGILAIASWVHMANVGAWQLSVVVAIATALIVGLSVLHHRVGGETVRRDAVLAVAMVVFGGFVFSAGSYDTGVALCGMLALIAGVVVTYSARLTRGQEEVRSLLTKLFSSGYLVYLLFAWIVSWRFGLGEQAGVLALATIVLWSASHIERVKGMVVAGQVALVALLANAWMWLGFGNDWHVQGVLLIAATIYYAAYWVYTDRQDEWRRVASLGATVLALAGVLLYGYDSSDVVQSGVAYGALIVAALVAGVHGGLTRNRNLVEVTVYVAAFGVQKIVELLAPEVNAVAYAHWWALVIAAVAYWRRENVGRRLAVAMAFISATTAWFALTSGGMYQLLFLVEHVVLLGAGALLRKQWAVWWGISASVIAILYFIKDYTFLWLSLLGMGLIALVIWRLAKLNRDK